MTSKKKLDSKHWALIFVGATLLGLLVVAGIGLTITGSIAYGFGKALFGEDFLKPVSTMVSPSPEQMARQEQQALSDIRGPRNASFRISLEYLASQVSSEAFGIILQDVESPEPRERELAAKLLKYYLRDDAALAALLKLEADKDPKVARKATLSLEDDTAATQADRASRIKALRERNH